MATKKTTTPTPAEKAKEPTRADLLDQLAKAGYTGPTSFTARDLKVALAWLEAGGDAANATGVPSGFVFAVRPEAKPVKPTKPKALTKYQQGYQQALTDISALSDLKAIRQYIEENAA
ncbi:hypothetical protein [Agromyces sp. GXS1127]|uniref:hypothetical protein n=1 Tax=Agromyces sp. GXS1127 TaxID=3424181 RepID=UPI003D30FBAC